MLIVDDACGRYVLKATPKQLRDHYNLANPPKGLKPNYNVAPGQFLPVVTAGAEAGWQLEPMKWGLVPFWAKDPNIGYKLINARDDTIFDKPMWRSVILRKRALVPASGFYEWKKPDTPKGRKQPFYIHPKQTGLFSFAGVWDSWKDVEGLDWKTFSIVTTDANRDMSAVHNRMPVMLHKDEEAAWLDPSKASRADVEPFLHPYEDEGLEMFEVSPEVNTVRNNDAKLILPINSQ
jgi:putative SOS response-associated peptidase YedK